MDDGNADEIRHIECSAVVGSYEGTCDGVVAAQHADAAACPAVDHQPSHRAVMGRHVQANIEDAACIDALQFDQQRRRPGRASRAGLRQPIQVDLSSERRQRAGWQNLSH
ncbi:MAG: Dabb family protein, partial [Anaerolineae bacterium]|nr:Dabb family protein [Anaerolineae bacterium]